MHPRNSQRTRATSITYLRGFVGPSTPCTSQSGKWNSGTCSTARIVRKEVRGRTRWPGKQRTVFLFLLESFTASIRHIPSCDPACGPSALLLEVVPRSSYTSVWGEASLSTPTMAAPVPPPSRASSSSPSRVILTLDTVNLASSSCSITAGHVARRMASFDYVPDNLTALPSPADFGPPPDSTGGKRTYDFFNTNTTTTSQPPSRPCSVDATPPSSISEPSPLSRLPSARQPPHHRPHNNNNLGSPPSSADSSTGKFPPLGPVARYPSLLGPRGTTSDDGASPTSGGADEQGRTPGLTDGVKPSDGQFHVGVGREMPKEDNNTSFSQTPIGGDSESSKSATSRLGETTPNRSSSSGKGETAEGEEEIGDGYYSLRSLGQGAFSRVVLAKRPGSNTVKAIKMIDKTTCDDNERMRISVVREVEVLKVGLHRSPLCRRVLLTRGC
jgi:hypothetical protein